MEESLIIEYLYCYGVSPSVQFPVIVIFLWSITDIMKIGAVTIILPYRRGIIHETDRLLHKDSSSHT